MKTTNLKWYLMPLATSILFFVGCNNGPNLKDLPNVPISLPVHMPFGSYEGVALDKNNRVWQWTLDKKWNLSSVEKIGVKNVHSCGMTGRGNYGWAVDQQGAIWTWSLYAPEQTLQKSKEKQLVKKFYAFGDLEINLHFDGTISSNGAATRTGFGAPKGSNNKYKYDQFKDIVDFTVLADRFGTESILAVDSKGDVYALGQGYFALKDKLLLTPTKVEGLRKIKKVGVTDNFPYAINEENKIFYWGNNFKKGINSLKEKGVWMDDFRVINKKGENFTLHNTRTMGAELSTLPPTTLTYPKGYGVWYLDYYAKKLVALDVDGKLWLYDYEPNQFGEKSEISNPVQIGEFEVNLDYYNL